MRLTVLYHAMLMAWNDPDYLKAYEEKEVDDG